MQKALLAVLLTAAFGVAHAATGVAGVAGSQSGANSFAVTGVIGNGASVQGTTNATQGTATVVSVAGGGAGGGAAGVQTNAGTTSAGLSVGATTGNGLGFTGGAAGSNAGSLGFGGFSF
ncbi:hypothetical protein [Paraburkholderia silvatlantica]|uniref:hypothetical protein n=1 Tax=Paraburkholderia silvatlantica TaxID=321895 RepID=UPI003751ED61